MTADDVKTDGAGLSGLGAQTGAAASQPGLRSQAQPARPVPAGANQGHRLQPRVLLYLFDPENGLIRDVLALNRAEQLDRLQLRGSLVLQPHFQVRSLRW